MTQVELYYLKIKVLFLTTRSKNACDLRSLVVTKNCKKTYCVYQAKAHPLPSPSFFEPDLAPAKLSGA